MCIIVVKPKEIKLPTKKTLKVCWDRNPDGAGYMFNLNDRVVIKKGFMSFNKFYSSLMKDYKTVDGVKRSFILHFRISTQGGVNQQCTHPFPLSANMEDLRKLVNFSDIGIAHNGIIDLTSVGAHTQVTYSDTMTFITDYLSLIIKDREFYKDKDKMLLIERLVGSKLAIMDGSGKITKIGTFIPDKGCYFSNSNYKPVVETTYYTTHKHLNWAVAKDGLTLSEHWDLVDEFFGEYTDDETVDAMEKYDFHTTYCPCTEYGTDYYCTKCVNYKRCWGHLLEDDKEI